MYTTLAYVQVSEIKIAIVDSTAKNTNISSYRYQKFTKCVEHLHSKPVLRKFLRGDTATSAQCTMRTMLIPLMFCCLVPHTTVWSENNYISR